MYYANKKNSTMQKHNTAKTLTFKSNFNILPMISRLTYEKGSLICKNMMKFQEVNYLLSFYLH